jgi:hypothetical protein
MSISHDAPAALVVALRLLTIVSGMLFDERSCALGRATATYEIPVADVG